MIKKFNLTSHPLVMKGKFNLTLKDAVKKFPNDYDLGNYIRGNYSFFLKTYEIHQMIIKFPNDYDLGEVIRKQINL